MKMVRGNAAVKDHEANGKELHLFEERGGGYVEYRGQMKYAGMEERRGHDVSGRLGIASYSIWLQSTRPLRSIF
jgi:5-methylcytosine-specific restriction protein A